MSIVEVKVPQLSESVSEATLLQWKKPAGTGVAIDEILVEIETDKVVLEVPAPAAGAIVQLLVADGASVVSGQVIAQIETSGAAAAAAAPVAPAALGSAPAAATAAPPAVMPAAARLLAESGLSASNVVGTGRDGRVTKGDVIAAQSAAPPVSAPAPVR